MTDLWVSAFCTVLCCVVHYLSVCLCVCLDHPQDHWTSDGNEGDSEMYRRVKDCVLKGGLWMWQNPKLFETTIN